MPVMVKDERSEVPLAEVIAIAGFSIACAASCQCTSVSRFYAIFALCFETNVKLWRSWFALGEQKLNDVVKAKSDRFGLVIEEDLAATDGDANRLVESPCGIDIRH